MFKPRTPTPPAQSRTGGRTYFVTVKTAEGKALLQSDRMATLLIDVLRDFASAKRFKVLEFVVLRNYFLLLVTVAGEMTIEKAVGLIKGKFLFRAQKEFGLRGWVWPKDFTQVPINGPESLEKRRQQIRQAAVREGRVTSAEEYPYGSPYLRKRKAAAAGTAERLL